MDPHILLLGSLNIEDIYVAWPAAHAEHDELKLLCTRKAQDKRAH